MFIFFYIPIGVEPINLCFEGNTLTISKRTVKSKMKTLPNHIPLGTRTIKRSGARTNWIPPTVQLRKLGGPVLFKLYPYLVLTLSNPVYLNSRTGTDPVYLRRTKEGFFKDNNKKNFFVLSSASSTPTSLRFEDTDK